MCLPQIIRQTLSQFHVQQICKACEELQVHCADCTNSQLAALKTGGYLAMSASRCGLITKSDAERLTSYLHLQAGTSQDPRGGSSKKVLDTSKAFSDDDSKSVIDGMSSSSKDHLEPGGSNSCDSSETKEELSDDKIPSDPVYIQHECFGTARGVLYPDLYTNPDAKCIRCSDCCKSMVSLILPRAPTSY